MRRIPGWVTAYAVAMGVLEAGLVVYVRKLYFPDGVMFPVGRIDADVVLVELWREVATVVMLAAVGALAGRTRSERFAWFMYAFGVWDLAYYGFLKAVIGWPPSLFTWDLLFLLPVPWFGPVVAPCLVALTMCGIALTTVRLTDLGRDARLTMRERAMLIAGSIMIILSFTMDWIRIEGPLMWTNITGSRGLLEGMTYVPRGFPWWLYLSGLAIGWSSWFTYVRRGFILRTSSVLQPRSGRSEYP